MAGDGMAKIARFNWPWYAAAGAVIATGIGVTQMGLLVGWPALVAAMAMGAAGFWTCLSLLVSHYVYDRSPVARGGWLMPLAPARMRRVAIFHAGHDEASRLTLALLPEADVQTFDFHDRARDGSPSLERARSAASRAAQPVAAASLPLAAGTVDLALIVFAAHEMRDAGERASFFRELRRVLAPAGRTLIVEHLRDGWNLLAYGPGVFHFLSRRTWMRSFAAGGLALMREFSCTPFVRVFELGRRT
jgi:SAM-dependent methyltransferase